MAETGQVLSRVTNPNLQSAESGVTRWRLVSLTATNYLAQIAAGSAINSTGPFTAFSPTRLPQIVLGGGGANPVVYTITGTSIDTGAVITDTVTATGPGTYAASKPFATITRLQSDVNPAGTTDLQAGDTWVNPSARCLHVGTTAGAVAMQCEEDAAVQTIPGVQLGDSPYRVKRINITNTAAAGLVLGW
jgi:hypothetical protein